MSERVRRFGPLAMVGALACLIFLGGLGAIELWGKREQRAAAEAIDTVRHDHWLVAEIQSRPRLEKPPLPRWITAALMVATGRQDEFITRLPNALAALGVVGLVWFLGSRIGGRSLAVASSLALCSMAYFVVEMRQAGNDGMLTFFCTLAIAGAHARVGRIPMGGEAGPRRWAFLFWFAMGCGFLTKGPVILMLAGLTIVPALWTSRSLKPGLKALADPWGIGLFLILAMLWPVPVAIRDPNAVRVWWLEIMQKMGSAGVRSERDTGILVADWPWIALPWTPLVLMVLLAPIRQVKRASVFPRLAWPYWWTVGSLVGFSLWSLAKPSYYLPCLPGVAILAGEGWVRVAGLALDGLSWARQWLKGFWTAFLVAGLAAPAIVGQMVPGSLMMVSLAATSLAAGVGLSVFVWRRGGVSMALAPIVAGFAACVLVGYNGLAPAENRARSHRELAAALDQLVPESDRTVLFFQELDEGLWFYLRGRSLAPLPGSQTRYNRGFDLQEEARKRGADLARWRVEDATRQLNEWAAKARRDRSSPYVLVRGKIFDLLASGVLDNVEPVHREQGVKRNDLVLLRVRPEPIAAAPGTLRR